MKNYIMIVEIPINKVPDEVTIQEAKVTAEIWLTQKIPDAKLIAFKEESHV